MELSIQDFGAIGEFVGSIAVLLTLGYLAVQTRASRQATDLQTFLAVSNNASSVFATLVASNPDAFQIFQRGNAGEPLDESELPIFGTILDIVAVNPYSCLLLAAPSPTRARALEGYDTLMSSVWDNPNFVQLWESGQWSYLPEASQVAIEGYRTNH